MNKNTCCGVRSFSVFGLFSLVGLSVAAVLLLGGCAGTRWDEYHFSGEEVLFSSDFSGEELPPEIGHLYNATHSNGMIHSLAPRDNVSEWRVETPVPRNSWISFRMKIGREVNPYHHLSMNFYLFHVHSPERAMSFNFSTKHGLVYYEVVGDSWRQRALSDQNAKAEEWQRIDLIIESEHVIVFVDGARLARTRIPSSVPEWGFFTIATHNELWVDELTIVRYGAYEVARRD